MIESRGSSADTSYVSVITDAGKGALFERQGALLFFVGINPAERRGITMKVIHDNISRRRFLSSGFMTFGLGFGMGTLLLRFFQFLTPSRKERRFEEILIGTVSEIPEDGVKAIEIADNKLFILREEDGFVAFSRRCTDLGCLVNWDGAKRRFVCPCHKGIYDIKGKNIAGPPPRPLERFPVVVKGKNMYLRVSVA